MKRKLLLRVISMAAITCMMCASVHKEAYAGQWVKSGEQWKYISSKGNAIGWTKINNKWYYFNESGVMVTGLFTENNSTYYLSPSGALTGGWQKINDKWYLFNSAGCMKKGWVQDKNEKYYLNSGGDMAKGWKFLNNQWFHLNEITGKMDTGWIQDKNSKYFLNNTGSMEKGFITVDNKTYYLKDNGEMATGALEVNGTKYEFTQNGELLENGNIKNIRKFTSDGKAIETLDETASKEENGSEENAEKSTTKHYYYYTSSNSSSNSSSVNNNININNSSNNDNNTMQNDGQGSESQNSNEDNDVNNEENNVNNDDESNNERTEGEAAPSGLTVSHLVENGDDGAISGLNPDKKYEYKLRNAETYTLVNAGSTEITGLESGIYDIRYAAEGQSENNNKIFTITLREKSGYNDYITSDDMKKAYRENSSSLQFSNDERIKKVIAKAEDSDSSEPINILLVGGSITYGYSSRTYQPVKNDSYGINFAKWLQKVFPDREVRAYDIGIPSSQSSLANARMQYELSKYKPDIVFIDYAVNDGSGDWDAEHYESLLRNILNSDTKPAVMLPMFSFFKKNADEGTYSVTQPVHCEIGEDYNLPMMRYGKVMQSVFSRIGNGENAYWFIKKLGYSYNRDDGKGELTHPGDEGHKMVADFYEDYFEKILNEYNSNNQIDEDRITFDGSTLKSDQYDDEKLLNQDVIATTDSEVVVEGGKTSVVNNNFDWYEVVPDKCAYPYYNDVSADGGTYIECDTLPCWESRTTDSSLTFTNVKGKKIGLWYYYNLGADSGDVPEHYRGGVKGAIRIEMTDSHGNVTTIDEDMPVKDYPNTGDNASAYAKYVELSVTNGPAKEFETIKIKPMGDDPNIQILGLAVSGRSN